MCNLHRTLVDDDVLRSNHTEMNGMIQLLESFQQN